MTRTCIHIFAGAVDNAFLHEDRSDNEDILVIPIIGEPYYEKRWGDKDLVPSCKFEKLKKAAKSLKWRAKNIDSWDNLAEEYRLIGERLMLNDVYQVVELTSWFTCTCTVHSHYLKFQGTYKFALRY